MRRVGDPTREVDRLQNMDAATAAPHGHERSRAVGPFEWFAVEGYWGVLEDSAYAGKGVTIQHIVVTECP